MGGICSPDESGALGVLTPAEPYVVLAKVAFR